MYNSVYCLWGFLLFVCVSSVGVYGVIIVGWSSNSKYAYLGCVRAVAQFISYEVVMVMIVLGVVIIIKRFDLRVINSLGIWRVFSLIPLFLM